ncbi:FecCD family ABC transporter permease [Brachybacterium phenoliresistens]|uniref:FecCD family ABC transporter permease n=1 Tax=Brachybacterium phenoliresistens TaxID=396014 RepID=UPI0031D66028
MSAGPDLARRPLRRAEGRLPLRRGPISLVLRPRALIVAGILLAVICLLAVVALGSGTYRLAPAEVLEVLRGGGRPMDRTVVLQWRLPRAVAAVALGALLGISGGLFQTVTRNPLASPDILGLANGAFTGMLLTLVLVSSSWPLLSAGAVLGGAATALLIWALARTGGVQGFRLIVVGIGVSAMLASLNTWMLLQIELETAMFAAAWGAGTLNGLTAPPVIGAVLCAVPLLAVLAVLGPSLRQLDLGDDMAAASGVRPARVRSAALLIAVALVSLATAVIGPVSFIALAAPQIARRLARAPHLSPMLSGMTGAALLLLSDLVAEHLLPLLARTREAVAAALPALAAHLPAGPAPVPLPAGVVTVSVGGLYLVLTLIQEIRRRA